MKDNFQGHGHFLEISRDSPSDASNYIWPTAFLAMCEDSELDSERETMPVMYAGASGAESREISRKRPYTPENDRSKIPRLVSMLDR